MASPVQALPPRIVPFVDAAARTGNVLFAWLLLLLGENLWVGHTQRSEFSASWELHVAHSSVTPLALAALVPVAVLAVAAGEIASRGPTSATARWACGLALAVVAAVVAVGVSSGRHMASLGVRVPFVLALAAVAGASGRWAAARSAVIPWGRRWPGALSWALAACAWWTDVHVLPHLYAAFHDALLALMLAFAALGSTVWTAPPRETNDARATAPRSTLWLLGVPTLAFALFSAARVPAFARRLQGADNLRRILVEHAPLLGRAVRLAAAIAPPPPLDDPGVPSGPTLDVAGVGEIPRALDWTGRDVLLLSVDALRADHVSAYGYGRPTTPHLDAIAAQGTLFESAYCPTPHTSYSITSMMTGKAMRPLLSLGLGAGSETWAASLRRYGYRTAAFYPPAVFFIDEERFRGFEAAGLDFEYRRVEFSPAAARVGQVATYLAKAPRVPLFVWVHLFEPHEPYEPHQGHPFGPLPVDAYDSEIAEADDAIGAIVEEFRASRPGAVVLVTADHGEEFGEHGGRYHGTSCYEEQVHVPMVVVGPGVAAQRTRVVVQTIDLLPTVLSALGIPRPARVRGRDLGPILARKQASQVTDPGFAYAETDEYTLLARGDDRLVCARKVAACSLFDVARDPGERHDRSREAPDVATQLRALTAKTEREQGAFEGGQAGDTPEALRRGLQGDVDAAADVAVLLDDARVDLRRKAAAVLFRLHAPAVVAAVRRAFARDEDAEVRSWCALTLVRLGEPAPPLAGALLTDPGVDWRRRAALAFAARGDARGAGELAAWWASEAPPKTGLDVETGKELLGAMAEIRDADAVLPLIASLAFVPLRPWIADALGAIGDRRARAPLVAALRDERYVTARPHEAEALLRLGARDELLAPLARFAGVPEAMTEAIEIAYRAKLLGPRAKGALSAAGPETVLSGTVTVAVGPPLRLLVLSVAAGGAVTGSASAGSTGAASALGLGEDHPVGPVHVFELPAVTAPPLRLELHGSAGAELAAAWVVPRAPDVPPPAPEPFDAGTPDDAAQVMAGVAGDAGRPEHLN